MDPISYVIKYDKGVYQAKVTELKSYHKELDTHLTKLKELREQMFQFWDDDEAQKVGQVLNQMIRRVENAMGMTNDQIRLYESSIEKFDAANISAGQSIDDALSILQHLD